MLKLSRTHYILAIAAALASLLPAAAHAQKPALVKDVDANGRTPYLQTNSGPQQNVCTTFSTCTVTFSAIPAGYRLVVTHVSTEFTIETPPPVVHLDNSLTGSLHASLLLPTPGCTDYEGSNTFLLCSMSSPASFYVEAGATPKVILSSPNNLDIGGIGPFTITIVGYLISTD